MTTLKGSEKQIAWATEIRTSQMSALNTLITEVNALESNDGPMIQQTLDWLDKQDSAGFWIDHRDVSPAILLKQSARAAGVM